MKLTILGNNGPFPAPGGACSGYLVTEGETKLLIDCGNGVLGNLQKVIKLEELDAIILTHLHSDHMSDMMVLRYAIQIKMSRGQISEPMDVYAPKEPIEEYNRLDIKNIFNIQPITGDVELKFGSLKFNFKEMTHPVKCFAVSVDNGQKRFVFSGDTSLNNNIIKFSRAADLLMLDAGLLSKDKTNNAAHLTASECGLIAKEAGVEKLLLTHFYPDYDQQDILKEARVEFKNSELSVLMNSYDI